MKTKLNATTANIHLTAREAMIVRRHQVQLIYVPGGMGPSDLPPVGGGNIEFGGACYVNVAESLRASVAAFEAAVAAKIAKQDAASDEQAGFDAFPAARCMDARRALKASRNTLAVLFDVQIAPRLGRAGMRQRMTPSFSRNQ